MGNKGHSDIGFGGRINHYDEHGKKTGYSDPGIFGGYNNYDSKGNKIGHSDLGIFGGYNHYDNKGNRTGHSDPNIFGGYSHYDNKGTHTGSSNETFPSHYSNSEGCYIATCVYNSYDCPEVWTLRRFRDNVLRKHTLGRLFVKFYYKTSPTIVKLFGKEKAFRAFWKYVLDILVDRLNAKGVSNNAYQDIIK